ncbi:MAG: ABC transporter permease [Actinobacteria bacterium]|nr:ABC transporter permease [Actinomycetota bacterium]
MSLSWVAGLLARRRGRLVATTLGVAIAVALLATIGAFLSGSTAAMTERAISRVPMDWQVEGQKGTDPAGLLSKVRAFPQTKTALPVGYADAAGYTATIAGASKSAGPGVVLGIPDNYRATYPDEFTQLIGAERGVLIAQQLAANLGVTVGDTVQIQRAGLPPAAVRVSGVIDLPTADALFQKIGVPPGTSQPPPPDNVMLLPQGDWHRIFDPLATARPDLVRTQIHASIDHTTLPRDPGAAYVRVAGLGKNLEAQLGGNGLVGNNLGRALAKARSDSLYARIVFLFLGLPGIVLAGLVTANVAAAGANRRRREQALMRTRGATTRVLVRLGLAETLFVALVGGVIGLVAALVIGRTVFGSNGLGATTRDTWLWGGGAVLAGVLVAAAAIAAPAWRDARSLTVAQARRTVGRAGNPWWIRYGLDFLCLAAAGLVFYWTGSNGYKLVLAVEGNAQVSVNYYSFLAPLLLWIGTGLLTWRIASLALGRGRGWLARAAMPLAGGLSGTVAASMVRQRRQIAGALTLVALTTAFAASTAAFNATYKQQAEVDARLSKGADVVVTESRGSVVGPEGASRFTGIPGVGTVEPLQHRFAYIGADLQDLYGVNAATIVDNAQLQDSFFVGGTARELFAVLAKRPNAILVSREAVIDYQLKPGDTVNLRIQDGRTQASKAVQFTYAGIAKKFPSAPSDSFFVANAGYVAQQTGSNAVGTFLIQTGATPPQQVAKLVAAKVGTTALVSDITSKRRKIAGSLTSVELAGLTRVELSFALILAGASAGLLLWLGLAERRRMFAIAHALGAKPRQLGSFIWTEIGLVTIGGLALGAVGATGLAYMLVKVLTGVFDPPPTSLSVPWGYLTAVAVISLATVTAAGLAAVRSARRPAIEVLRDL